MTAFEQGLDAAMSDLLEHGPDLVTEVANESAENEAGLNSKFSQGYRRFAFHHMKKVVE